MAVAATVSAICKPQTNKGGIVMGKHEVPITGEEMYRQLPFFASHRRSELAGAAEPIIRLTDAYGVLISRAVVALGRVPPVSARDTVVRDLIADVFDFLYEWPRPLFEGRFHVAYPLARRAYESLSLLSACHQDDAITAKWAAGKEISNGEIRKAQSKMVFGEDPAELRDLYRYFSLGSHPNRVLVAERHLGDGNAFVLGSIGAPELVLVADHCIHLVEMWFWFGALTGWIAKEALLVTDKTFGQDYLATAREAMVLKKDLVADHRRLLAEVRASASKP